MVLELSLIIPAKNEAENISALYKEVQTVLKNIDLTWELIFVDDGSTDSTYEAMAELNRKDKRVTAVRLRGWFGKAIALKVGFERASGKILMTMDADLQDDPAEIPHFLDKFKEDNDLVVGWKKKRLDPWTKVLSSRVFNFLVSLTTRTHFHDINCGFKAYRREVIEMVEFGELFRFIPVLAVKQNFRAAEIIVNHRPRKHGKSKFGFERGMQGLLDLLTIVFLTGYLRRPGQFFGVMGLICGFLGGLIGLYVTYLRVTTGSIQYHYPLLFLGVLLIIVGVQFVFTGLLAEMIVNLNEKKRVSSLYVSEIIPFRREI